MENKSHILQNLKDSLNQVIQGKNSTVELLLQALVAGGHVLIEDVPGTGKTTLAVALARLIGGKHQRVQCTPDLMPADITGASVYDPRNQDFRVLQGPVFCNVFLADEINRASPRTQSSLLEAMEEHQVSIDGQVFPLPDLFFVLATQNPVEFHGVFTLPEAQIDRFMVRLSLGYPERDDEARVIRGDYKLPADLQPTTSAEEITLLQKQAKQVEVHDDIVNYILDLLQETRRGDEFRLGGSSRAGQAIYHMAQARAFMQGRSNVVPDDILAVWSPVMVHRLISPQGKTSLDSVEDIPRRVNVPV